MPSMLKVSISGIRGTVPDSLTDEVCLNFAKAFGTYTKGGKIVLGTDTRESKDKIKAKIKEGLLFCGCEVIDLGIATTPTVGIMVKEHKAQGGIIITASHNPLPWNGLKFLRPEGFFLNEGQGKDLIRIYKNKRFKEKSGGKALKDDHGNQIHIKKILEAVDAELIRSNKFKVVIDSVNGAGSIVTPYLLEELGCQVITLNCDPLSPFPHGPEPTPENLKMLEEVVKKEGAQIGFAQDPDADRLALVTDSGAALSEEYTLPLCMQNILNKSTSTNKIIVVNLSTSSLVDDVAKSFKARVVRTKIGEINVVEKIIELKAEIGGEGNGGVIFPRVCHNRDSLSGIALILELLAKEKKPLSEIVKTLPAYFLAKKKIECRNRAAAQTLIKKAKNIYKDEDLDLTEGVKVKLKDAWVHVRASNTEPIIRVFAEAKDKVKAEKLASELLSKLNA